MAKKRTAEEQARYDLRERLIKYYAARSEAAKKANPDKTGGPVQKTMAKEIPCSIGTLNPFLTRGKEIKGMAVHAITNYLNRMEAP